MACAADTSTGDATEDAPTASPAEGSAVAAALRYRLWKCSKTMSWLTPSGIEPRLSRGLVDRLVHTARGYLPALTPHKDLHAPGVGSVSPGARRED